MFGETLRAHRLRLGMTQEELAGKAGVGVRTVRDIEAGRINHPRLGTVRLLADAFALSGAARDDFVGLATRPSSGGPVASGPAPSGPAPTGPAPSGPAAPRRPAQLPTDVAMFTGRERLLAQLTGLLPDRTGPRSAAVVVTAVGGMAGVGKTALAVHWSHSVAHHFPDGQLYVNLRGFDASGPVLKPAEAIRCFLDALGVLPRQIPTLPQAQVGLYRSLLAGRRILVLLDTHAILSRSARCSLAHLAAWWW